MMVLWFIKFFIRDHGNARTSEVQLKRSVEVEVEDQGQGESCEL
jgi:hypothetical protein